MERIDIEDKGDKISVNATQIISKYRSIKDRMNFCFEKNWYHPKEIGFDSNFFLKVLMGEKKYLPNNFTVNYKLHYFRKGEKLDKNYIIEKMKRNPAYAEYTPDIKDPKKFSKDFLLLLIAYIEPNLYRELYAINKSQLSERVFNKWGDYKIDVQKDLLQDIQQFTSINPKNNSKGGFKLTKNHASSNTFYKYRNIDEFQNINQNEKEFFKNQMQRLEILNQEHNKKNQELAMENQMLKQELRNIEKHLQKNNEKSQVYENMGKEKEQNKSKEEIEYSKRVAKNYGEENKTIKIKLSEASAKNKK